MVYPVVKRFLDVFISILAVLILWPILILIFLLIKSESRGPFFFKQRRIGKGKKEFYIYKFRSMYIDTPKDVPTHLLKNSDASITRVGRILRKLSLDELPQIINILKGEMSIIGPRPALWNQFDLIAERDKYGANDILPGLTGWAQVNGRDELSVPLKAAYDGQYVMDMSFWLDVKIFFLTVYRMITSKGVVEGMQNHQVGEEPIKMDVKRSK